MRADFGPLAPGAARLTCTLSPAIAGEVAMIENRAASATAPRIGILPALFVTPTARAVRGGSVTHKPGATQEDHFYSTVQNQYATVQPRSFAQRRHRSTSRWSGSRCASRLGATVPSCSPTP